MKRCPGCGTFYEGYDKEFCDHDGLSLEVVPEPEKAEDPFLGTVVDGRYLVESILGKGGMGAVYKARQTSVERDIALKVILGETDEDLRKRFMLEAKMTSSLQSVHTVTIFDFGVFNDVLYLAMEFLEGRSLEDKLDEVERLDWRQSLEVVQAIAESLEEAHDKGIVHRDLKPANIHLAKMGSLNDFVKVLDFGVAKFVSDDNAGLTGTGMIVGTPNYMSPEQARAKPLDARSDIYALGIMLYEMLTGLPPFTGEATVDVLLKHVSQEPPPILDGDVVSALPKGLRGLVMSMLEKDPDDRPQSAKAVQEAVKTLLAGGELGEGYTDPVSAEAPEESTGPARRKAGGITGEEATLAGPGLDSALEHSAQDTALSPAPAALMAADMGVEVDTDEAPTAASKGKGLWFAIAALVIGGLVFAFVGGGEEPAPERAKAPKTKAVAKVQADPAPAAEAAAPGEKAAAGEEAKVEAAPKKTQKVTIVSTPPGATVILPNGLSGTTPLTMDASDAAMKVTLKKEGYVNLLHTIPAGHKGELKLSLAVDVAKQKAEAEAKAKAELEAKQKAEAEAKAKAAAEQKARKARARRANKGKTSGAKPAAKKPSPKKKPKAKSSRPSLF